MSTYNFEVKSSIHNYAVDFVMNFSFALRHELKKGDIVIIDEKVLNLYRSGFEELLTETNHIVIKATEDQKSYLGIMPVIRELIDRNLRKNNKLIAIGGGITQDVTAFISSIMYRGIEWLFFPTTLLAQADSCIGSKTSVNFEKFKNQLGNFYPPSKIFIDLSFLETLSKSDFSSGLGEMCHYFIISGEEDYARFAKEYSMSINDRTVLEGLIARSLEIKKSIIEIDEFDKNERQVFNYGHSFGHAIESVSNYKIPHGIAVGKGMDMANFISEKLGYISSETRMVIREVLMDICEDFSFKDISLDKFKSALSKDKKNVGKELVLILNKGFGEIFKSTLVMDEKFDIWLQEYFDTEMKQL